MKKAAARKHDSDRKTQKVTKTEIPPDTNLHSVTKCSGNRKASDLIRITKNRTKWRPFSKVQLIGMTETVSRLLQ